MSDSEVTPRTNLEELRRQVGRRLALVVAGISALGMWLLLPQRPFLPSGFWLAAGILCLAIAALLLFRKYPTVARYSLVGGLTVAMAAGLPEEFVARKRTYWRLAYNLLSTPYHYHEHCKQIQVLVAAAKGVSPEIPIVGLNRKDGEL